MAQKVNLPKLAILRGKSGSGKTFLTQNCFSNWHRVSADDFFELEDGSYQFDASKIQLAHDHCFHKTMSLLGAGENVVLDNTNAQISWFERYLKINEKELTADIRVLTMMHSYGPEERKRVPQSVIDSYDQRFQPLTIPLCAKYRLVCGDIPTECVLSDEKWKMVTRSSKINVDSKYVRK